MPLKILKICKKKPISFEVFADNPKEMLKQAYKINNWGRNVYVKIPVVNSKGIFMGSVIRELSSKGIKLNITAVYTYCLLYTSPSPRDKRQSRMPSSA